jgi:hypothetical protein
MRVFLFRMVAAKNSRNRARGRIAGISDHAGHDDAVASGDLLAHAK